MIRTSIIPVATATAQEIAVEATERLCKSFCILGDVRPAATVSFSVGEATVINSNAIVPITATITVTTPSNGKCGCAHTQVFNEHFSLAFEATGSNLVTIVPGATVEVKPAMTQCCKANAVVVITTLTATIA